MCDPVSIGMGAMGVGSSIFGFLGAKKEARAQADYQNKLMIQKNENYIKQAEYQHRMADWAEDRFYKVSKSVQSSVQDQYTAVLESVEQAKARSSDQMARASRSAQQASSFIRASAAETGTTGASVRLAQQQAELAEARFKQAGWTNLKNRINQSQRNLRAMHARGQSQVNMAMPAPMAPLDPVAPMAAVQKPSAMPYLLQAGQSALGAYANHQSFSAAKQGMALDRVKVGDLSLDQYQAMATENGWWE